MKINLKLWSILLVITLIFIILPVYTQGQDNNRSHDAMPRMTGGLIPMTHEEEEELKRTVPQIEYVRLNTYALTRTDVEWPQNTNFSAFSDIVPVEIGNEITSRIVTSEDVAVHDGLSITPFSSSQLQSAITLPPSVDNSGQKFFPPIGNQGNTNSCVAWSMGYYMMTNNLALARDLDARNNIAHQMAPMMLYNLANAGIDSGSSVADIRRLASTIGCASRYDFSDTLNINQWPSSDAWRNAIDNKVIPFTGNIKVNRDLSATTSGNLEYIKRHLLNGYVVTFGTFFSNSLQRQTPHGIWVVPEISSGGAHAMTIVGYDDNFYFDINGNGIAEPGEYGAFKVANSWGTGTHNAGFIWIMYDAFDLHSSVPANPAVNFPSLTRWGEDYLYYLLTENPTTPVLLAEIDFYTASREGLIVEIGYSETNTTLPGNNIFPFTRVERHSIYSLLPPPSRLALDGFTRGIARSPVSYDGKVTLDLTNMIEQFGLHGVGARRFYVNVKHNGTNNATTTVRSIKLISPVTGATISSAQALPVTITGNSSVIRHIDASPALIPLVSSLNINLTNLRYNGTFLYDSIALSPGNSPIHRYTFVFVDVIKHPGATLPPPGSPSSVYINFLGNGTFTPSSSLRSFDSGQHLEIIVYNDIERRQILSRKIINPALFNF